MSTPEATLTSMAFVMKQGDLLPAYSATLLDAEGDPVDLSGAASIEFRMRRLDVPDGETIVVGPGTSTDPTGGNVTYNWDTATTDVPGHYAVEWIIYSGSNSQTYPASGSSLVIIEPRIAVEP